MTTYHIPVVSCTKAGLQESTLVGQDLRKCTKWKANVYILIEAALVTQKKRA